MIGYIQIIDQEEEREQIGRAYQYELCSLIGAFFGNEKIRETTEETSFVCYIHIQPKYCTVSIEEQSKLVERVEGILEQSEVKRRRNEVKRLVYQLLCRYTKKSLPWGTLTGIRPTKIAMEWLQQGKTKEDIISFYEQEYLATIQKAELSYQVAKREGELLSSFPYKEQYSLYVGIPFCPTTCLYCSFPSYPVKRYEKKVWDYLEALKKEIAFIKESMEKEGRPLSTIYMGGGTPTALSAEQLDDLLSFIRKTYRLGEDKGSLLEFTVEAGRPDSITREKLKVLKKHHIDRISINPQTMKNATLEIIGRDHTVEDTKKAFCMAREEGMTNINMDLIVGLPKETVEDVRKTLQEIEQLQPESLTVHSLAIKRAAALNTKKDEYVSIIGSSNEMLHLVEDYAKKQELIPYYLYRQKNNPGNLENVGYSKKGMECLYNILIMEEKQIIMAAGSGASSKYVFPEENRVERIENVKDVDQYISRIDEMIERKRSFLLQR